MSITPVDKPPDGDEARGDSPSRRCSRIRSYVGRFVSWLGGRIAEVRNGATGRERAKATGSASPAQVTEVEPEPVTASDCPAFENFPGREQPLTYPARNSSGINTPDVVSIETNEGLRLSVPENPDAELTSDVWMPVEP